MIEPPVYDENEPPYTYIKKVNEYIASLKRDKYKKILGFVNTLTEKYEKKYKSLCDFKNITYLTDNEHNKKILEDHGKVLAKDLSVVFDFDDITEESIYDFIDDILSSIDYSLIKKTFGNKIYYSIDNTPKTNKSNKSNKNKVMV